MILLHREDGRKEWIELRDGLVTVIYRKSVKEEDVYMFFNENVKSAEVVPYRQRIEAESYQPMHIKHWDYEWLAKNRSRIIFAVKGGTKDETKDTNYT